MNDKFEEVDILNKENLDRDDVLSASELAKKDWNRDKVKDNLKSLRRSDKSSESKAQSAKDSLGKYKENSVETVEDLKSLMKDNHEKFFNRVQKDAEGNPEYYPKSYVNTLWEREKAWRKFASWQARMKEADRFVALKVGKMFRELLDEYRLAKSYDTIEDAIENKVTDKVGRELDRKETKMQQQMDTLKQLLQATREERNSLHRVLENLADKDEVDADMVAEVVEKSTKDGLDQFVNENGMFVLDSDELDEQNKRSELDEAADSAAENVSGSDSDDLSVRDEIARDWESEELYLMDVQGIADIYETDEEIVEEVINERDLDTHE